MLTNMREYYNKEDRNLVYITIFQSDMDSAINSSAFEFGNTNNDIILSHVLGMFNRFIRSNASLRLEKDFSVFFVYSQLPMLMIPLIEGVPLLEKSGVKRKKT